MILFWGCASVLENVMEGTVSGLGQAASEHAANEAYKAAAPDEKAAAPNMMGWNNMAIMQAQMLFAMSFSAGGLWLGRTDYQPGEWAKFEMVQTKDKDAKPVILERAFLKAEAAGNQWWRTAWYHEDMEWIYEALLSPTEGKLLRLRAKDKEGKSGEIPVTEQNIYMPPAKVTEESIKGATVGSETVRTHAGSFRSDHIVYMAASGQGKVEFWATDKVPGGVAKYLVRDDKGEVVWTCTLKEKGGGAATVLESY
jgi:hypothetical protein